MPFKCGFTKAKVTSLNEDEDPQWNTEDAAIKYNIDKCKIFTNNVEM